MTIAAIDPWTLRVPRQTDGDRIAEARRRVSILRDDFARWARKCYRIKDPLAEIRRKAIAEAAGLEPPNGDQGILVPLRLNRVQNAIEAAEQEQLRTRGEVRLYVLKGRQGGVTTMQQAKNLHLIWKSRLADAMTLADSTGNTDKIFEITRRAIDNFPASLLPKLGPRETTEISFPLRDSHFWTGTAGAKRTGMGLTLKRVHASEFAHWADPDGTLATIGPSLNGVPGSAIVLETTASGFDTPGHRFWREAEAGVNGYRPLFFPWWDCDPQRYRLPLLAPDELGPLELDEHELVVRFGLCPEQIKWRRETTRTMGVRFLQEYAEDPETCWIAPGGMFFDAGLLKHLLTRAPEPISVEMGGELRIYGEVKPEDLCVIGCDTAEGGGGEGDRSAFVVRAMDGWRLLAAYASRSVTPKDLAGILAKQGKAYAGCRSAAFQVVEKNSHGITVLRELRDAHEYPLDRIYHRRPLDQAKEEASERIGWATTAESQPLLLDAGREVLNAAQDGLASAPAIEAIRDAFAVRRDGRGGYPLTGRDELTAEMLAWIGRTSAAERRSAGVINLAWM